MTDSFALYKLIILYMLKKVDFPLTTAQISEFILDKGYTSFSNSRKRCPKCWRVTWSKPKKPTTVPFII